MGLDMYLYKKTYVKNWDHTPKENQFKVAVKRNGKTFSDIDPKKVQYIVEQIGYWRKANSIHSWFVQNVQEGLDNCQTSYVRREDLEKLLGLVNTVLANSKMKKGKVKNGARYDSVARKWDPIMEDGEIITDPSVAKELLPAYEGSFFGGYDYDENYVYDLKNTKKILTDALADEDEEGLVEFEYHSSW